MRPPPPRAWSYKANAEILLMGPCLYGCYYCIGNQMPASVRSDLRAPFRQWENRTEFAGEVIAEKIPAVYISSPR